MKAIKRSQNSVASYFGLVLAVKRHASDVQQIVDHLKEKVKQDPDNFVELTQLALLRFFSFQDLKALRLLNAALSADCTFIPALVGMGEILRRTGNLKEAKKYYELAIKLDKGQPSIFTALSNLCYDLKDYVGAYDHLQTASRLSNDLGVQETDLFIVTDDFKLKLADSLRE